MIEEGSILKASHKLNVSQSSISMQITSLEKDVGLELFLRENQKLTPTKEAIKFYKMSRKFVDDLDFMFSNAKQVLKTNPENKVRIAGHSYSLSHILPPFFEKMVAKHKDLEFELFNTNLEESLSLLSHEDVDFAIFPFNKFSLPKGISVLPFYKCKFAIGMHKNHPLADLPAEKITWDVLAKHDFITLGKSSLVHGFKPEITSYAIKSRFFLHDGNWDICAGVVKQGLSISGADVGYGKWHQDLVIKECPHLMPEYEFNLIVKNDFEINNFALEMLEMLRNYKQ